MKTNATYTELIAYVHLLKDLKETGVKCDQEISRAIKALNETMFTEEEEKFDHVNILVLVDTPEDFDKARDAYHKLLRVKKFPLITKYGHEQVFSKNTKVIIVDVYKVSDMKLDGLAGQTVDIVDNRTKDIVTSIFLRDTSIRTR